MLIEVGVLKRKGGLGDPRNGDQNAEMWVLMNVSLRMTSRNNHTFLYE